MDQGDVTTFQAIAGLISASVENLRIGVLTEMDRLKTEFFANVSHEFRTPITLTLGPLEQILAGRHGEVPPAVGDQLRMMWRNQERLLGLINQILDLAKLEAGNMRLSAAPMPDMNRFVEERAGHFRTSAERRGIELRLSLDPRVREADLVVDHEKLDRLLFNLLSNALKFTKTGTIEVATELHQGALRLTVADTGIGIKENQLPYIFDRFRQADGGEAREYAGTGIGLALVKEIAALHGGDVKAYSQYGKGSSFQVSIPVGKAHLNPASIVEFRDDAPAWSGSSRIVEVQEGATGAEGADHINQAAEWAFDPARPTIVYAEDNPDLRVYVRDLLAGRYNVFVAVDGRDGLEKAGRYRPDLILSDVMMPQMSGREFLRAVRADPALGAIPVLFLTARAGAAARTEGLEAGADDYLAKPFDEGELLARVRNLLHARAQERRLVELNQQLAAASRHKSEFLANMSHELRTPLNAIIGFSEVLLEQMFGELNDKQLDYLQDIFSSGHHLLSLINDILDLSKVEAGQMEVEAGRFALGEVLEHGLTMVRERASHHGIALSLDVDPRIDVVEADERKVKQVVFNLLSNAVKFTPDRGQVEVTARLVDETVQVAVRDTGVGIAAEDQARIFAEFQQAGHASTLRQEGTGLGLALAKRFVELHGGRIWVESRVGSGSTFTFALPTRAVGAHRAAAEEPPWQGAVSDASGP
jgi:signal transduction histidine kinase